MQKTIYNDFYRKCILVMAVIIPLAILFVLPLDIDTPFLLNSGRYILSNGLYTTEPFSCFDGLTFMFQQWGTDVYFYALYQLGGTFLLSCGLAITYLMMCYVAYQLFLLVSYGNKTNATISLVVFILAISPYITARPQISSVLIVLLMLYCLEKYIQDEKYRTLFFLPLLSVIEINLHAAVWWILPCFLFLYLFSFKIRPEDSGLLKRICVEKYKKSPILLSLAAVMITSLVNPYFIDAPMYLLKSFTRSNYSSMIGELAKPTLLISVFVVFSLLIVFYYMMQHSISMHIAVLLLATFAAYIMSYRNIIYFAPVIGLAFSNVLRYHQFQIPDFIHRMLAISCSVVIMAVTLFMCVQLMNAPQYDGNLDQIQEYFYENVETENTKIGTDMPIGNFLEFDGYRCGIDGRMEIYLKSMNDTYDYYPEYIDFIHGAYYKDYLDKYQFDYLVYPYSFACIGNLMHDEEYELVLITKSLSNKPYYIFKHITH